MSVVFVFLLLSGITEKIFGFTESRFIMIYICTVYVLWTSLKIFLSDKVLDIGNAVNGFAFIILITNNSICNNTACLCIYIYIIICDIIYYIRFSQGYLSRVLETFETMLKYIIDIMKKKNSTKFNAISLNFQHDFDDPSVKIST